MNVLSRFDTYEAATAELPFRDLRKRLGTCLEEQDQSGTMECVDHFKQITVLALGERSMRDIAKLREQLRRARTIAQAVDESTELRGEVVSELTSLDQLLDIAGAIAHIRATKRGQRRASQLLADRILAELDGGPSRSKDLAEACGCDRAQVSRIITSLTQAGAVVQVPAPEGQSDRRARWHALASDHTLAARLAA